MSVAVSLSDVEFYGEHMPRALARRPFLREGVARSNFANFVFVTKAAGFAMLHVYEPTYADPTSKKTLKGNAAHTLTHILHSYSLKVERTIARAGPNDIQPHLKIDQEILYQCVICTAGGGTVCRGSAYVGHGIPDLNSQNHPGGK